MKKVTVRHPDYVFSKIKNIILFIFSFECQLCGVISLNNHIHHIDKNHKNNNPLNLTCLCPDCHILAHSAVRIKIPVLSEEQQIKLSYLSLLLQNLNFKL